MSSLVLLKIAKELDNAGLYRIADRVTEMSVRKAQIQSFDVYYKQLVKELGLEYVSTSQLSGLKNLVKIYGEQAREVYQKFAEKCKTDALANRKLAPSNKDIISKLPWKLDQAQAELFIQELNNPETTGKDLTNIYLLPDDPYVTNMFKNGGYHQFMELLNKNYFDLIHKYATEKREPWDRKQHSPRDQVSRLLGVQYTYGIDIHNPQNIEEATNLVNESSEYNIQLPYKKPGFIPPEEEDQYKEKIQLRNQNISKFCKLFTTKDNPETKQIIASDPIMKEIMYGRGAIDPDIAVRYYYLIKELERETGHLPKNLNDAINIIDLTRGYDSHQDTTPEAKNEIASILLSNYDNIIDEYANEPDFKELFEDGGKDIMYPYLQDAFKYIKSILTKKNANPRDIWRRLQLIKRQYKVNPYRPLGEAGRFVRHPYLVGTSPELIKQYDENFANELSIANKDIILAVFGKNYPLWLNKFKNSSSKIHDASQILPQNIENRNELKGLGDFLLKWYDKGYNRILKTISAHWNKIPDEMKLKSNPNEIFAYIIQQGGLYPGAKSVPFATESHVWGLPQDQYSYYENIYNKAQEVPLPDWTQIEPVQIGKYIGRFIPRSDTRGMYAGEYSDCCQHPQNVGAAFAIHGQLSPQGAFFFIEDSETGSVVAQSWTWGSDNGKHVIFDNIEGLGLKKDKNRVSTILKIYQEAANRIKQILGKGGTVRVGTNYGIGEEYFEPFEQSTNIVPLPKDFKNMKPYYYDENPNEYLGDSRDEQRRLAKRIR